MAGIFSARRAFKATIAAVLLAAMAGCSLWDSDLGGGEEPFQDDVFGESVTPGRESSQASDDSGIFGSFFSSDEDGEQVQLPVNRHLWRATLDTLSFLPLSSTDPYGGVIVTDWGAAPDTPNERFKVTAYITSAVLKPQALRVVVNRQVQDDSGGWVAADVAAETARQLEDAILTRARQLRQTEARDG